MNLFPNLTACTEVNLPRKSFQDNLTSRGKTMTKTNENAEDFNEITVIRIL